MKVNKWESVLLILGFMSTWDNLTPQEVEKEEKGIRGNWVVESWQIGEESLEWLEKYGKGAMVVITAGQIQIKGEESTVTVTYRLISDGKPAAIDFIEKDKKTIHAIYKLGENTLTLCIPDSPDKKRPTEFKAKAGSDGRYLIMLKRKEKEKEKSEKKEKGKKEKEEGKWDIGRKRGNCELAP